MGSVTQLDEYASAQRDARIVELRAQRVPFRKIAEELGIHTSRAHQLWQDILRRIPAAHLDDYRQEARELADEAINSLTTIARDTSKQDSSRIRAWEVACKWAEQMSKLNGEYAPVRREVEITDTTSWEYQLRASIAEDERATKAAQAITVGYTITDDTCQPTDN